MLKLEHDFHVHTHLSSCAKDSATIEHYVTKARELGIKKLGLADHMWDSAVSGAPKWYVPQNFEHISAIREEIAATEHEGIEFLVGCECEYDRVHEGVAISEAVAEQLDFLIVPNSHTHITMPKDLYEPHRAHAEYMLKAFYDIINSPVAKYVTAIPHPFMAVCCPYPHAQAIAEITDDEFKRCFDAAANKGIAMEINPNHFRHPLPAIYESQIMRMYRIIRESGCKFTLGTDSHSDTGHDQYRQAYVAIGLLGLKEDDFHPLTRVK